MYKAFDLIVWDWDGTIANSTGMIARALVKAAEQAELPSITLEKASSIIGLGLRESIATLFGEIPINKTQLLAKYYNENYAAGENDIVLFSGIYETIATLHKQGCKLGVATGKGRGGLNTALKNSGLNAFFQASKTVHECYSKPHPQMLTELMDEFNVMSQRTLMIGDSEYDIQMGKNAKVVTAAVTYGSQAKTHLQSFEPDYMFDDVPSLQAWLLNRQTL